MILQALCSYYDRVASNPENGVAAYGYAKTGVSSCIVIDEEGDVRGVDDMTEEADKKYVPRFILTPLQPKRTGQRPKAAFMCENANFIFGINEKYEAALYRFEASQQIHQDVLAGVEDNGAQAVLKFFAKRVQGASAYEGVDTRQLDKGNIVFRLFGDDMLLHDRLAIKKAWEEYQAKEAMTSSVGQCLITGRIGPIARLHGNIGGFGTDKPTLVGFNQDSFVSYRKNQGDNAPVSEIAAFQYITALNMLVTDRRHCINLHGEKVLFWAERNAELEENSISQLFNGGVQAEEEGIDSTETLKIKAVLSSLYTGKEPGEIGLDSSIIFYILGLSSNKTRLVVRFFHTSTFGELVKRLLMHYEDISINGPDWERERPNPFILLRETAVKKKSENVPAQMISSFMRSILNGTPYPRSLFMAIISRIRAEAGSDTSAINRTRIGTIKGYLNRLTRQEDKKEMMTVSLNEQETNPGYLLGRMFAILEKAQRDALGDVNASIVDKYLNSALATPQAVFNILLTLAEKHMAKSKKYYSKKQLGDIMELFPSTGFPQTLSSEEQGRFMVGYYHQRQAFFKKNQDSDNKGGQEND